MVVRRFFQLALLLNFALTLYLFFQQGLDSGVKIPHFDKVGHFIAFFVLALCTDMATKLKPWAAMLLLLLYGVIVELVQGFIPGREASWQDVLADAAGFLFYYYVFSKTTIIQRLKNVR